MTDSSRPECARLLSSISAYLDGELEAVECEAIDRHTALCPRCAGLVEGLRRTIGLCRGAASSGLPEAVRARARESVRRLLDGDPPETGPA
jgi:anti-sigma factor RsiW